MKTIVKKYGGATLADPAKIKQVAHDLNECHHRGDKLVVVVSAMGQTTNELIALAQQVSSKPKRRELDMLLTTGERISMSLLSLALNDLHCPAISFTGSQAGILTDTSHSDAFITDVNSPRVKEALTKNQVIIIAGFQGVSPLTKEVTTLGRGGSDTTAVALAAALKADQCEILKDVPGVFSADPRVCPKAFQLPSLTYTQMLEMTFWGAKVLHYRSLELALQRKVPLYIGPAHQKKEGTWILPEEKKTMFESIQILSLNSHPEVLQLQLTNTSLSEGLRRLKEELNTKEIAFPQLLATESIATNNEAKSNPSGFSTHTSNSINNAQEAIYLTGPQEVLQAIKKELKIYPISSEPLCTITATCTGASTPEIATLMTQKLSTLQIKPLRLWMSAMSCTLLLPSAHRLAALTALHELINIPLHRE